MAIFDRLFGRRKKDEQTPAPESTTADLRPSPQPQAPPTPVETQAPAEPARPLPRRALPPQERPASATASAQAPAPAPAPAFTPEPSHLDGWEPSAGPAEALERFRSAPAGLKTERARRELSRHMIATPYFTVLGPGGDGKPTIKAAVINSERMLTVYTDKAAAEEAKTKNGQVAAIPGEILLAWVLSQPKVQGLRIDPAEPNAPKDFDRAQITEALTSLVNPGLREVLVSEEPTPQKGLVALRAEGTKALVVQRRTGEGLETMQLAGPRGEVVLPVFTSESEVYSLGTSLAAVAMDAAQLRELVAELGAQIIRVNPSGPSLDLPATSL